MINPKNFLTSEDDPTVSNTTFLSRPREYHAILAGFLTGLSGSKEMAVALTLVALGRKSVGASKLPNNLHFRDAAKEPVYAVGGWLLGLGVHALLWAIPSWLPI